MDWLTQIAPTIATAFGGPLAGAAAEFLASKFGASDKTVEGMKQTLSGMTGDQLVQLKQADLEFQKHMADNGIALQMGQIEVNKNEASSPSMFVAGWRPMVGWVCAMALAFQYLIRPMLMAFGNQIGAEALSKLPGLDDNLWQLMLGLLGVGTLRTVEKIKGAS